MINLQKQKNHNLQSILNSLNRNKAITVLSLTLQCNTKLCHPKTWKYCRSDSEMFPSHLPTKSLNVKNAMHPNTVGIWTYAKVFFCCYMYFIRMVKHFTFYLKHMLLFFFKMKGRFASGITVSCLHPINGFFFCIKENIIGVTYSLKQLYLTLQYLLQVVIMLTMR